jgi:hypothetical protein
MIWKHSFVPCPVRSPSRRNTSLNVTIHSASKSWSY